MFENPRRGRQARNFTANVPKILVLKSSSEQIFSRKLPLGAPEKFSCFIEAISQRSSYKFHNYIGSPDARIRWSLRSFPNYLCRTVLVVDDSRINRFPLYVLQLMSLLLLQFPSCFRLLSQGCQIFLRTRGENTVLNYSMKLRRIAVCWPI